MMESVSSIKGCIKTMVKICKCDLKDMFALTAFILLLFLYSPHLFSENGGMPGNMVRSGIESQASDGFESDQYFLSVRFTPELSGGSSIMSMTDVKSRKTESSSYFPDNLYRASQIINYNSEIWQVRAGIRSASDKLFNSSDEAGYISGATYRVYKKGSSSVFTGFMYNSKSQMGLRIPIPVVNYRYTTDKMSLMLGLPFSRIRYNYSKKLMLNARFNPPRNFDGFIQYRVNKMLRFSTELSWKLESYQISGREDKKESLFLGYKKAGLNVSYAFFYVYAGYMFDASYFKGHRFNDVNEEVSVDNSLILSGGIQFRF